MVPQPRDVLAEARVRVASAGVFLFWMVTLGLYGAWKVLRSGRAGMQEVRQWVN